MGDVPVYNGRAVVYKYDRVASQWKILNQNYSTVAIYHHQTGNIYRVISLDPENQVLINSMIFKDLNLQKAKENFYQWSDSRGDVFGLNFAEVKEAEAFGEKMNYCINILKKQTEDSTRIEAEKKKKDEDDRIEAERKKKEDQDRIEAERKKKEDDDRIELARKKKEDEDRIESARKKKEEQDRIEMARKKKEDDDRIEMARKKKEDDDRIEMARKKKEDDDRIELARKKKEDEDRIELARKKKEEQDKNDLIAKKKKEDDDRNESARKKKEEQDRIEAERKKKDEDDLKSIPPPKVSNGGLVDSEQNKFKNRTESTTGQTKTSSPVKTVQTGNATKEDLDQFKQDIYQYIDKKFEDLFAKLKS